MKPGDSHDGGWSEADRTMFQSTPGYEAGRFSRPSRPSSFHCSFNPRPAMKPGDSKVLDTEIRGRNGFQSTPGYEAGRFVGVLELPCGDLSVSIHARL